MTIHEPEPDIIKIGLVDVAAQSPNVINTATDTAAVTIHEAEPDTIDLDAVAAQPPATAKKYHASIQIPLG